MDQSQIPELDSENEDDIDDVKIPWHFWVLVALFALYMAFRLIQIIIKLIT